MESGYVVEFIDDQKICCAVVLETKTLRLRLLTENNREVKLSTQRLSHRSRTRLDLAWTRDKLVAALKEISTRRRALSEQIDIQDLWQVLHSEQQWIDLPTMTAFCFPQDANGDHEAAVMRAFFSDRLYFKFSVDQFMPHTKEKVDQILAQRETQDRQTRLVDQGADWLQKNLKAPAADPPPEAGAIIDILSSYYLFENDSPQRDLARGMLRKAGIATPARIFNFLVKQGVWNPHENIDLLRYRIRPEHPRAVADHAQRLCRQGVPLAGDRRDLRHLKIMTIDGSATLDFDDGLSLTREAEQYVVGIHIADVGFYVSKGDPCDQEAMARASSIYTPDLKIAMLPGALSEGLCSLKINEPRPAITTLIRLNAQANILDFEIVPSLIQVDRQLTYSDVDAELDNDARLGDLLQLARAYHARRLDNGALPIELPEISVNLNHKQEPAIIQVERETSSRFLVAELMIMANAVAAGFIRDAGLPAVFRSQPEPRERLFDRDQGSLFQNWMQRKQISRFVLSSSPEPHTGLGLAAYATFTSPIRKYTDLVNRAADEGGFRP